MVAEVRRARGSPGSPAHWAPGRKSGIGTAIAAGSRVWFTAANGVLTEVFYPGPDTANLRSCGLLVADDAGFVSDEELDASHEVHPASGSPLFATTNTCLRGRYRIDKEIIADPFSDVVLQRVRFVALCGEVSRYRLFCVAEPHLGNRGDDNTARLGDHKGMPMLLAERAGGLALALACSVPWRARTVGYVGAFDGRAQVLAHGRFAEIAEIAEAGNVSLAGEVGDLTGELVFALAFARTTDDAAYLAHAALARGYAASRERFLEEWSRWVAKLEPCPIGSLYTRSAIVLKSLEAKRVDGGRVAALSTPWGPARGPGLEGTYHLVWTRDLVETLGGLLAAGARAEARDTVRFLRVTQEPDGRWPQNMYLAGNRVWHHGELDEDGLPIVLVHLVARDVRSGEDDLRIVWPLVRAAAGFLARTGPSTAYDRWEDTAGITPYTIAIEIVALLIAAGFADEQGEPVMASYLRDVADEWNALIEPMLYRRGGALAEHLGITGYYVRARVPGQAFPPIRDPRVLPRTELSPDALALVRFGLRAADDPRIADTVRAIDAVLRVDLPGGPAWHRYPGDEYGEHADGAPFDGHGIGRAWPLFVGERAHFELARGDRTCAEALLCAMERFAEGGLMPEQVWDGRDVPERGLIRGNPTGSATPLGWAHAEYVKLCRSLAEGRVFDMPPHAVERYVRRDTKPRVTSWRIGDPVPVLPADRRFRVVTFSPATIEWSADLWATSSKVRTTSTGLGLDYADLGTGPELRLRIAHDEPRDGDGCEVAVGTRAHAPVRGSASPR